MHPDESNKSERTRVPDEIQNLLREALESDLEPLAPDEALKKYLEDKRRDARQQTVRTHKQRLQWLIRFLEEKGTTNLNELTSRDLRDFRNWRLEEGNLSKSSDHSSQITLRVFLRWAERMRAVRPGLSDHVEIPALEKSEEARDETMASDRAAEIIDHLEKYEYASRAHVTWMILAVTGIRVGALCGLDLDDYYPEAEVPHLELHHRPGSTPLKNGEDAERCVCLPEDACRVLDDYIQQQRPEGTEDGRQPLITTQHGRVSKSTIARDIYRWSRPCKLSNGCPHDRARDECEASQQANKACRCPSSQSPHPIRRGYITQQLRAGVPMEVVSNRCDVTKRILQIHYDQRDEEEKMELRKQQLKAAHQTDGGQF